MKEEASKIVLEHGPLAAVEWLNRQSFCEVVAGAYEELVVDLYWNLHDLTSAIVVGLTGIQYAFTAQEDCRANAKAISYNLGSFCWPGWDEPGIVIDATALVIGRDASRLNLRLAHELKKGDLPLARAHWLIGAHEFAAGSMATAKSCFEDAAQYARAADARTEELLAEGYGQLVSCLETPADKSARIALDAVRARLNDLDGGPEFVNQIDTAERIFRRQSQ